MDSPTFLLKLVEISMTSSAEILKAVAWPIVVLILAFEFREQWIALLRRMTKLEILGASSEFSQDLESLIPAAAKIHVPASEAANEAAQVVAEQTRVSETVLEANPSGVIMEMWAKVRSTAAEIANELLADTRGRLAQNSIPNLYAKGFITDEEFELAEELGRLRNEVARGKMKPSTLDAERFRAMSEKLILSWVVRHSSMKAASE
ncbi:hypothetical protein [Caballeronia cordobensis]|uniref:hypothetical protein n=1 Tax=Caballeronia cordobensis TaxID=1353886 RepID=UPI0006AD76A4|nr:hypothetical protein [Caballeronia cordobensis]